MTERGQLVLRRTLEFLRDIDGRQAVEPVIHAQLNLTVLPKPTLYEVEEALRFADSKRWIIGVPGPVGDPRWSLSTLGQAALNQL